jgi:hypothetical protein
MMIQMVRLYPIRNFTRKMRLISTSVLIVFLNTGIFCQSTNAVLDNITLKFQTYCKSFPREEIFVQSDRDIYIAGEEVYFSVFLFDRQSETLTGASRIAYFEILNPNNRPVAQVKAGLNGGTGSGKVVLPDTIGPGIYTLRAYTNWMKNFMPANCFSRKIKIYGVTGQKSLSIPIESQKGVSENESGQNGIKAMLIKKGAGLPEINIYASTDFREKNNNLSYVFLETHGVINYKSAITLSGDTTRFEIPPSVLISGINHLTVFNSSGQPVNESYSYTKKGDKSRFHLNMTSPDTIRTREKVLIGLESSGKSLEDDTALLTITVVPSGTKILRGIEDYLVFGSEFGLLPDSFIETPLEDIPDTIMHNFLSSIKSNWIDWNLILNEYQPDIKYQRETRYHYLYGSMFNNNSMDSSLNRHVFLSIPGKNATLQYAIPEPDGSFCIALPVDDNTRDLVIQTDKKINNDKIVIQSSFSDRYPAFNPQMQSEISLPALVPKLGINYRVMKIYKTFEPRTARVQEKFTTGSKRFYGKPDIELIMADYIKLPTMQEVFFELLPGISIKSENAGYKVIIRDPVDKKINDDPLLLIDGVVISDAALIYNLDPQTVEKIDVIKSRYVFGDYIFSGLINVITTLGIFENIRLPEEAVRFKYRDYEPENILRYPDYSLDETLQSHVPDFRNTLYGNSLLLSASGQKLSLDFFASDFISDYDIIVQGVTRKGRFISEKRMIKVQK